MSHFSGRKCDHCGVEDRDEHLELEDAINRSNQVEAGRTLEYKKPWMKVWWQREMHFCPNCAEVANKAMGFARDIRR